MRRLPGGSVILALVVGCRAPDASDRVTRFEVPFDWAWDASLGVSTGPIETWTFGPDLISFAVFVDAPGASVGLSRLEVDGEVWIDASAEPGSVGAWYTPPTFHWATLGGGVVAPIDPGTDPAGASRVRVAPAALDDRGGSGTLIGIAREGRIAGPSRLNLNVAVVGDTELGDRELDAVIASVDRIWTSAAGPSVGEVTQIRVEGSSILRYRDSNALRRTPLPDLPLGVTVFVIADYANPGTLGEAGGIPGPLGITGVDGAGVIVALDPHTRSDGSLDTDLLGGTLAHELGHQLGLFHTTESDGSRYESLDTPACPPEADTDGDGFYTAEECAAWDGPNFMFWTAGELVQEDVSDDQAFVLDRAPIAWQP